MGELIVDDIFKVQRINPDGKKYDKGNCPLCSETFSSIDIQQIKSYIISYCIPSPSKEALSWCVHLLLTNRFLVRMGELIFDDIFKVQRVNPDGKKYDKVTRIEARSEKCDMFMQLDVNTEIYPIDKEERFLVALSTTLSLEGGQKSLADKFEYIMHGKLYKISDEPEAKTLDGSSGPRVTVDIYVSFGGLQLMLKGDPSHCGGFELDQKLFLLMRKLT